MLPPPFRPGQLASGLRQVRIPESGWWHQTNTDAPIAAVVELVGLGRDQIERNQVDADNIRRRNQMIRIASCFVAGETSA
ncbi:MAG: hypothetical protein U1G07_11390 [Verrucomicrobiota bacterium]